MTWANLWCVIVINPGHTHLLSILFSVTSQGNNQIILTNCVEAKLLPLNREKEQNHFANMHQTRCKLRRIKNSYTLYYSSQLLFFKLI